VFERVLIVGGGVAAMRCAVELRRQGYDGRIRMVSSETTLPYDRTLVSKQLLSGEAVDETRLLLQPPGAYEDAAIDVRRDARATGLDVRARRLELADG
jgi:NADPH-dependent 2,4-dienoyl-CoA reductase/sulfur reductase-like enzyme